MARRKQGKGARVRSIPVHCVVCGNEFLTFPHLAPRAKVCTLSSHQCKSHKIVYPSGAERTHRCGENCCRSKHMKAYQKQFWSGLLGHEKVFENQEELDLLLANISKVKNKQCAMAIQFMVFAGVRVGETLLVRYGDLFLDASIPHVMVPTLKKPGHPKRRIDLPARYTKKLGRWVGKGLPTAFVFTVSKRSILRHWKELQEKVGASLVRTSHALRHTHFTRLAEQGVDPRYSQSRAGWSSLKMYEIYAHITKRMRESASDKLPDL